MSQIVQSESLDDVKDKARVLVEKADKAYQQQDWTQAVIDYQKLVEVQEENEQAWYRLAQILLQLKQGKQALHANSNLKNSQNFPMSLINYQKAQALNLTRADKDMWQALELAVKQGFRNLNDLNDNLMWKRFENSERFSQLKQSVDKNVRPCMYDDNYRAFDFWLGEWEVYGNLKKTGPIFGVNTISQTEQGCLIMEQWQGSSGSTGTSMNYYHPLQQKWNQKWVSGGGTIIDYAGGLIENGDQTSMQLVGQIYYPSSNQKPQTRDFRGTWTPLDGGVVQQFFEESIDGGKTWYTWFNGFYFPANNDNKSEN